MQIGLQVSLGEGSIVSETTKPLSMLENGESAVIESARNEPVMKRRLYDLGFAPGTPVECVATAAFGDPKAYLIKNTVIALRCEDSDKICVRYKEK